MEMLLAQEGMDMPLLSSTRWLQAQKQLELETCPETCPLKPSWRAGTGLACHLAEPANPCLCLGAPGQVPAEGTWDNLRL